MADFKQKIDVQAVQAAVAEAGKAAAEQAIESLHRYTEQLAAEIKLVAETAAILPNNSSDLFAKAEASYVAEINMKPASNGREVYLNLADASLDFCGYRFRLSGQDYVRRETSYLPPGRYRAIVAIVKVG